jgi:uncharacterized protein Yka (UPF0111/DUF47 family)
MRLLPKAKDFFFELDSHVARIVDASALLLEMTESSADLAYCAKRIKDLKLECDAITHRVIFDLHKTFVTPLDRLGTHDIISGLDQVMGAVEQAAYFLARTGRVGGTPLEAVHLVEVVVSSIDLLSRGIRGLKRIGSGDELLTICQGISKLERQADALSRELVEALLRDVRDAATLLEWKEAYEALARITDHCNDVATVLEGVVLDSA